MSKEKGKGSRRVVGLKNFASRDVIFTEKKRQSQLPRLALPTPTVDEFAH